MPQRRSSEHHRLSGTVEVITGGFCYVSGFLALGAAVLKESAEHMMDQNIGATLAASVSARESVIGAGLLIATGVFLQRSGDEHLAQADRMASRST